MTTCESSHNYLAKLRIPQISSDQLKWENFRDLFLCMVPDFRVAEIQKILLFEKRFIEKSSW